MDEANTLADEQILLQMKQEDFETIRVQNPIRYKAILKQYIRIYQPQNLQEFAMCIIKKPSEERNEDEINILQQWTSRFQFFQDLNRKQINVELRLHHKCCGSIKYERVSKGTAVFQAGDIPEKFYIVLSGSVNVMLPKSKEQLVQEVNSEKNRIKNLKTLEIKNSIWYRINQIKDRREQLKTSKNISHQQSLSPHHNTNFFKIPSIKRVDSFTTPRQQNMLLENSFSSSPRFNNLRPQNSSRFDPALTIQGDEINMTASNFSEHMDQSKLNFSQMEDRYLKNQNFTNKMSAKDNILLERHHNKRGSVFNDFRQFRRESLTSDLNFSIKKDESADVQASIFKRQNSPEQVMIDFKNLSNESEENSVVVSDTGNGQQEGESQNELFSTLKIEENNILDENDPAYKQLGNIQLEAIQDLDIFFQEGVSKYKYLLTLNPGSMFGELGLLLKKPRAATILAREDTEFAVLNAGDFSNILSEGEMKQINRRLQFFAENFLQGCGKEIVTKYSYNFKCVKYSIGNIIYHQGDSSQFVYIIKKGFVELSQTRIIKKKQNQLDQTDSVSKMLNTFKKQENQSIEKLVKEKVCLSQISVGQCFGEIEVIKNMPRISHAICISNKVVLWELPATIFQKLITENKFLYQQFLDQIKLKEEWYQKQEISHDLQKEIKAEISESAKDFQQKQAIQEEIQIRKQKLQKKYSLTCHSFIKGQDEDIEKHIKLELLKEELEKDMKILQDLKQVGGYDFLKKQELVKSVEIIGIKKQLNLNQIHKLQRQGDQFDQKVFKVMQKIEHQKKQMKDLIRKIMIKNSYKYMPKFKLSEFIGMDIKHALNIQIFSALQNQTKTQPQKSFETQEEKVDKKLQLDWNQESLNKDLLDKQVDQQDLTSELLENNFDKQLIQPNLIDGSQIKNDKDIIIASEQGSQKFEIKKKIQNIKQNFKNKLELAQFESKKSQLFSKFKSQIPANTKDMSPFSPRISKSLLIQQNTGNFLGIGNFQEYLLSSKTTREKIMASQNQLQKNSQINNQQQNNINCRQIQQIHSNSARSLQTQNIFSNEKGQRQSLNIAEQNSNDLESTRSKQYSQRESALYFNNYNLIQQNIHNKQMDSHSSIFTVKPFFYTKNQQNTEIQKALPKQNKFREKNIKNMKAHSSSLKVDSQLKLNQHQKPTTDNVNKIEYFFKSNEEILNFYNINSIKKDCKRETFQSTQETFRKQHEQDQQKSFQTQNQYVKNISKMQEKDNFTDKQSDGQRLDHLQSINTNNDDIFQSFHSINTNLNGQNNFESKYAFQYDQQNLIAEGKHNIIRSQSNPNITQNYMQFNRKNCNLKINQSPILSNSQQIKLKSTPPIEQSHIKRDARFRWSINSQKHSADCLITANQTNSLQKNQQQNEKDNLSIPISPILLKNDSYQEKNFYMYNLNLNLDKKPKSSLLSKTEQSIQNQSIKEQDDKNLNLQSSFCQSTESYNQPLIQKHIQLSNSPKIQNFVEMNRNITKPVNKQNNYTIKKKTNINPICLQEYNDNGEQDSKYNQEKIIKQLIKCRARQKPKNSNIKETKEDKLIRIKKSLLNYCDSSSDLSNSQTHKGSVESQSQYKKSSNRQTLHKRQSLGQDQSSQMQSSTAYSFYPNFDEIQNQISHNTANQYTNSPSSQERNPSLYNQNSFTSTKHNMFRQKPQKLFLLHNSSNYPQQIQKIESILRIYKKENIK